MITGQKIRYGSLVSTVKLLLACGLEMFFVHSVTIR